MSEDQALALTATLGFMVLVLRALMVRRLSRRHMGRIALLWLLIFAAAFLIARLFPSAVVHFT